MDSELEGYGEYTYHKEFVDILTEEEFLEDFIQVIYDVKTGRNDGVGTYSLDRRQLEVINKMGEDSYNQGLEEYNIYCSLCVYFNGYKAWTHNLRSDDMVTEINTLVDMDELIEFGRSILFMPAWVNTQIINQVMALKLHDLYSKELLKKSTWDRPINIDGSFYDY